MYHDLATFTIDCYSTAKAVPLSKTKNEIQGFFPFDNLRVRMTTKNNGSSPRLVRGQCSVTADSFAALRNDKQKNEFLLRLWNWLEWRRESRISTCFAKGEGELLLGFAIAVVGADYALDEVVAHDVDVFEVAEADAFDTIKDVEGFEEAGFLGVGQVGLGEVAGDDGLGVGAEAGDKHLHLFHGRVLGLVHDDEGVVEGAAAHEGERGDLDDVGFEHLVDLDGVEEVVEGVVERAKVGVDLFLERAGEEAETFAGFDCGADEDDATDFFRHEGTDGHGDGEIGFAGAGGAEAEG